MKASVFPQNIREEQCNPGIMPNVIKEVFMPPSVPRDIESRNEIATRIESALVYQNSGNYDMAVKALEEAREMW